MHLATKRNEQSPTFSVIIATYNRAHLVGRAIRSVLAQTYQDFEVLVVDDGSTDETPAAVGAFDDPRLVYLRREQNGGASATRNMGIRRARGKYISFLDDDDEFLPEFLAESYRVFEAAPESVGFGWCGIHNIRDSIEDEKFLSEEIWQPDFRNREHAYLSSLRSRGIGSGCGLTVRRTCFDIVGLFDEALQTAVDTDILVRFFRHFDFVVVPKVLVKVHKHNHGRVSDLYREKAEAYERIVSKHLDVLTNHPDLWTFLHYKVGLLYYRVNDATKARRFMVSALRKQPFYLKAWFGLLSYETLGTRASTLYKKLPFSKLKRYMAQWSVSNAAF